jgi:hypothetical protein
MEDTIGPRGQVSRTSGRHGRRTALLAAPALAAVGLTAGALAGGPAHALAPQPPHPTASPQQHPKHAVQGARGFAPSHTPSQSAQPSPGPSRWAQPSPGPSRWAQPSHGPSQSAQPSHAASHEGGQRSQETQGAHRSQGADLRLVYDRPEAATGESGVIWRWTVVNEGATRADDVVATQKITSGHKVLGLSKPCASDHETVVCRFDAVGAGEKRTGWIKTSGSIKGGPLRVDAKMTWREPRQGTAAEPGGRHPGH